MPRNAIISSCGRFRYSIESDPLAITGPTYGFFGVNPSRADSERGDTTTGKWDGFVTRWGGRRWIAGNMAALRSHDVRALAEADDPIGPENDWHLMQIMEKADIYVPCWGDRGKLPKRLRPQLDRLANVLFAHARSYGRPILTFGLTKGGDPKHPLMLGYATPLVEWNR